MGRFAGRFAGRFGASPPTLDPVTTTPTTNGPAAPGSNGSAGGGPESNGTGAVDPPPSGGSLSELRATLRQWSPLVPAPARSALLGAATGLRSQMGMAAVLMAAGESGRERLPERLRHNRALRSALIAAVTELLADKLPRTGSRLRPGPLAARLVLAGYASRALAHAEDRPAGPDVAMAVGAALVSAKVGYELRRLVGRHLPDPLVGLGEDAVAIALAAVAVGPIA
jgi:uncharacterized membrane protein